MCSLQSQGLKRELEDFLIKLGAFKVGIADPQKGIEKAVKGCHPLDLMKDCRSVIVFVFNIGLDYYLSMDYQHNNIRLGHLYRDWTGLQLVSFLRMKGYDAKEVPRGFRDKDNRIAFMSFKHAAYEAGIGVYGRPGIIITPEYGPRVNLSVVLTDAQLEPDQQMTGFNPCTNCTVCVEICPIRAIKEDLPPPLGFKRDRCVRFVDWIREETKDKDMLCGYCFDRCPAGKRVKKTIKLRRWKTLKNTEANLRKQLISAYLRGRKEPACLAQGRVEPRRFVVGCDFEEFKRYSKRDGVRADLEVLKILLPKDSSCLIVWKENNEIIGHAIWHETNTEEHRKGDPRDKEDREILKKLLGGKKDFVELHEVWLIEKHRGKGYGKRFFEFFEEFTRNKGYNSIVFYAFHPAAIAICRQRGYKEDYLKKEAEHVFYKQIEYV